MDRHSDGEHAPGCSAFCFHGPNLFQFWWNPYRNEHSLQRHTSESRFLPAPLIVDTSDGYGVWRPIGEESNQFAATFQRFLFAGANTSTELYGSFFPGQNIGLDNVEAVATLHTGAGGDTLTGPFTTQFVNFSGQPAFAGSGTFSATRFKIKPLS